MAANLSRELETVHRECRSLQRVWLAKQGELVATQVHSAHTHSTHTHTHTHTPPPPDCRSLQRVCLAKQGKLVATQVHSHNFVAATWCCKA